MKDNNWSKRIYSLDGLRGLLAFHVMLYHYIAWSGITLSPVIHAFFLKIEYVMIGFFMISGFSMYYMYSDHERFSWKNFYLRRFFRIAPLYYLVILYELYRHQNSLYFGYSDASDLYKNLILNFSLLFGLNSPALSSMIVGGWSIGVEWIFYILFPFLILFVKEQLKRLFLIVICTSLGTVFWTYMMLNANESLAKQWVAFASPCAYVGYFCMGALFAHFLKYKKHLGQTSAVFGLVLCLMMYLSIAKHATDQIESMTGYNYTFALMSMMGMVFFTMYVRLSIFFKKISDFIGKISYSLYLLHYFAYTYISVMFASKMSGILASIIGAIFISTIIYYCFERVFMNIPKLKFSNGLQENFTLLVYKL